MSKKKELDTALTEPVGVVYDFGTMREVFLIEPKANNAQLGYHHRCMYLDEHGRRCTIWPSADCVFRYKNKPTSKNKWFRRDALRKLTRAEVALGIGAARPKGGVRSAAKDGTRAKPGASRATPKKNR